MQPQLNRTYLASLAQTDAALRNWGVWARRDGVPRVVMPYEGDWLACNDLEAELTEQALLVVKARRLLWWRLIQREYLFNWARASMVLWWRDVRGTGEGSFRVARLQMLEFVTRRLEKNTQKY